MASRSSNQLLARRLFWRAVDRLSSESMVRRRKTHSILEIKTPWRRKFSWGSYRPAWLIVWRKGDKLSVTLYPWLHFRRWAFSRCEGCGGRFKWGYAPVSTLTHMHASRTKSVVLGETGLYHGGCPMDPQAEDGATDGWDRFWGHDDGLRRNILNEPVHVAIELSLLASVRREADRKYRTRLVETRRELGLPDFQWKIPADTKEGQTDAA